jgi:hypothetical protein
MAKSLTWERHPGCTYTWVLGLHYYAEQNEDGDWLPRQMINRDDSWNGGMCRSQLQAEAVMQEHFDAEIAKWVG